MTPITISSRITATTMMMIVWVLIILPSSNGCGGPTARVYGHQIAPMIHAVEMSRTLPTRSEITSVYGLNMPGGIAR